MKFRNEELTLKISGKPSTKETEKLKQLKKNIIDRKRKLKVDGFNGGQVNNDGQNSKWSKQFDERTNNVALQHALALASLPSEPRTP